MDEWDIRCEVWAMRLLGEIIWTLGSQGEGLLMCPCKKKKKNHASSTVNCLYSCHTLLILASIGAKPMPAADGLELKKKNILCGLALIQENWWFI